MLCAKRFALASVILRNSFARPLHAAFIPLKGLVKVLRTIVFNDSALEKGSWICGEERVHGATCYRRASLSEKHDDGSWGISET